MTTLDDLRGQARGQGRTGCHRCGDATAGSFSIQLREPNLGRKNGQMILSRSASFCEKHLVEAWEKCIPEVGRG